MIYYNQIFEMVHNPFFSVIIPTYNRANILPETINSVLTQTFSNFEIIIVDNGSTDNTNEIVLGYHDPRVRYFRQIGTGSPAGPRNTGIKLAQSKWICLLDSDDLWYRTKLEITKDHLDRYPDAVFLYHPFDTMYRGKIVSLYPSSRIIKRKNEDINRELLIRNFIGLLTVTVRKDVLEEFGGFDENPKLNGAEDWDLWFRIATKYRFQFIEESLGIYRYHDQGFSKDLDERGKNWFEFISRHVLNNKEIPEGIKKKSLSSYYLNFAERYYLRGNMKNAREYLKKAISKNPNDLHLFKLYLKTLLGYRIVESIRVFKYKYILKG